MQLLGPDRFLDSDGLAIGWCCYQHLACKPDRTRKLLRRLAAITVRKCMEVFPAAIGSGQAIGMPRMCIPRVPQDMNIALACSSITRSQWITLHLKLELLSRTWVRSSFDFFRADRSSR